MTKVLFIMDTNASLLLVNRAVTMDIGYYLELISRKPLKWFRG